MIQVSLASRSVNSLESLQIASKRNENTSYTHDKKGESMLLFSPYLNYFVRSLYSHTNSYDNAVRQCHVDGAQRAWATCACTIQECDNVTIPYYPVLVARDFK